MTRHPHAERRAPDAFPVQYIGGDSWSAEYMTTVWQAKDVLELLPVLRLNNSKLRLTRLICPNNHLILTVYQTAAGPVAAYHRTTFAESDVQGNGRVELRWWHHHYDLAVVIDEEPEQSSFLAECKCGPKMVPLRQLIGALVAGKRRAVLDLTHHRP